MALFVAAPCALASEPWVVDEAVDPETEATVRAALAEAGVPVASDGVSAVVGLRVSVPSPSPEDLLPPEHIDAAWDAFYGQRYDEVIALLGPALSAIESAPHAFADRPDALGATFDALIMFVRTLDAVAPAEAAPALARVRAAMWGLHPDVLDVPPSIVARWDALRGPAACVVALDGLDLAEAVRVDGRTVIASPFAVPCRPVEIDTLGAEGVWRERVDPTEVETFDVAARVMLSRLAPGATVDARTDAEVLAGVARVQGAAAAWVLDRDATGAHRLARVDADGRARHAPVARARPRDARAAVAALLAPSTAQPGVDAPASPAVSVAPDGGRRAAPLAAGLTTGALIGAAVGLEVAVGGARRGVSDCADDAACVVSGDIDAWRDTARARRSAANVTWAAAGVGLVATVVTRVARGGTERDASARVRPTGSGLVVVW